MTVEAETVIEGPTELNLDWEAPDDAAEAGDDVALAMCVDAHDDDPE